MHAAMGTTHRLFTDRGTIPATQRTPRAGLAQEPASGGTGRFTWLSSLCGSLACLLASACVLLPPGTSTGEVAARREAPPIVLGSEEPLAPRWSADTRQRSATRAADLVHISAELTFDLEASRLYGSATSTFRMMRSGVDSLLLDAEALDVREIVDGDGRALAHRPRGGRLEVGLEEPVAVGDQVSITVRYASARSGAFEVELFDDGTFRPEAFALARSGALARWLPTSVAPGELCTVDLAITLRDQMAVVSNGVLAAVDEADGGSTAAPARVYRWSQRVPIPLEAIVVAAGRFTTFASEAGATALYFHMPEGTEERVAELNFGESSAVLAHFEGRLGRRFPFPRYDQVVLTSVDGPIHDGATLTLSDASELSTEQDTLDDRRERPRRAVSRGLARKWFGAWWAPLGERHQWLLDGLSCQLELDYETLVRGDAEVDLEWEELRERLARQARELADPAAAAPDPEAARELRAFRAGWALRIIRARLGEEDFWRVVRRFAAAVSGDDGTDGRVVTAEDFRRAGIDELGVDLGPELAQWSQRIGVPELEVRFQRRRVVNVGESLGVLVKQVQPGPLFVLPLELTLHFDDGSTRQETMILDREETLLVVRLDARLIDVTVDPRGVLLADLRVEKDEASWLAQALPSRSAVERRRAIPALETLAIAGSDAARQALVRILLESPEPTLREHCATAITFPGPAAVAALLQAAEEDESPRVRRASLRGLYQAFAGERWAPSDEEVQQLLALRQREVAPSALEQIERLLSTIPGG